MGTPFTLKLALTYVRLEVLTAVAMKITILVVMPSLVEDYKCALVWLLDPQDEGSTFL
jgi:hypothetical protein